MPEDATPDVEQQVEAPEATPAKPQTLEEMLADLDEDRRKVILDQVNKPRNEAKGLRERLKALEPKAAEYDRLEQASKTDLERVQGDLSAANQRAANLVAKAARSEIKAALTGIVDNPDTIVRRLDLSQFVDDDGEIDEQAVAELKAEYAPFSAARAPRPDRSQASSGNGKSTPMTPQEEFGSFLKSAIASSARG